MTSEDEVRVEGRPLVVLQAKLNPPASRREWVRRTTLLRDLRSGPQSAVVLVDAPAGYGKSTLLAQWAHSDPRPFAWVTLDAADSDPVRFWTYVIHSIAEARPDLIDVLAESIRSPRSLRNVVLPRLLNELAIMDGEIVIVLEDYHLIRNPACHELLSFFHDNLAPTTQLVISTRADPPLGVGKLRVERRLKELRARDLLFTHDEADMLLRKVLRSRLHERDIDAILDHVEGWPAGVYLAAISLRDTRDVPALLERFTGGLPILAEYLTGEVLQRQPRRVYNFLTRTSILESFTASLASEVVGEGDAIDLFAELETSNLFVVPLDDRREWLRYHQLFQQFLSIELERRNPDLVIELHSRASAWYRRHGFVGRAIHHAIEADDVEVARDLIWDNLLSYVNQGRVRTINHWLTKLGRKSVAADPVLSLAGGWAAALTGRVADVTDRLRAAERGIERGDVPDRDSLLASIALLRALYGRGPLSARLGDARLAIEEKSIGEGEWNATGLFALGFLLLASGGNDEAREVLEKGVDASRPDQPMVEAVCLASLSVLASETRDVARARAFAMEAQEAADRVSLSGPPAYSLVHTAMGKVLAEEGDLFGAESEFEAALSDEAMAHSDPLMTMQTLVSLAPVRFALGDREGARDAVRKALQLVDEEPDGGVLAVQARRLDRSLGRPAHRPALYGETLTDRELSILRLLASPLTHREIGEALFISLNTVKSHVRSLYQKLMVSSRADAVTKGRELGLI